MIDDLTSAESIESYLSRTTFVASKVIPLSGGHANFAYRIILQKPYKTGTGVPVDSVILKYAAPYIAFNKQFPYSTERLRYEALALKHVRGLTHPSPVVSTPKLYYEDHTNCVMVMSDSGITSKTLKALFRTTPPDIETCRTIGQSLGVFIARLHTTTCTPGSPGSDIKALFYGNQVARRVTCHFWYGHLVRAVAPETQDPILEPPLNPSPAEVNVLAEIAKNMQDRIMTRSDVLTMGDFWPGNIMVSLTPELHLDVIDWEAVKPGLPGVDLGQFLAEMYTLRAFDPSLSASVDAMVSSLLEAYRSIVQRSSATELDLLDVAWTAATHIGTHLVTITPGVSWGSKEATREVALEGLTYLFRVSDKDEAWLRTSMVQGLLDFSAAEQQHTYSPGI